MSTPAGPQSTNNHDGHAPVISRAREILSQNPRLRAVTVILAVLLTAVGLLGWRYLATHVSTDDAQIDGHVVPIASRVGGTVLDVQVADNQAVAAGAVLVRIDPRDHQVALRRAQADLDDAQAALAAAENGVPITSTATESQSSSASASVQRAQAGLAAAEARQTSAQARLREAKANDERAQRDLERMRRLATKDEVSQQQLDLATASASSTRATLDAAQAAVAEAEQGRANAAAIVRQANAEEATSRMGPRQVEITRARAASARARLALMQAALEQARLNLEYATVKAPVSGVVSKRSVEPGQVVAAGQPLLAVVPLDDLWVIANFKETQLARMRPGQRATIEVDAYGRSYHGHVDSIAAATGARFSLLPPENASGNYVKVVQRVPVKILFEKGQDSEHLLRPGMSVVPTVITR